MRIVAAVDGSEHTQKVVQAAKEFAGVGDIDFVYVSGSYIYPYMVPAGHMIDFESVRKSQTQAVWEVVGDMPSNGTAVTLDGGAPAPMIVDYAKNVDADLIIVGSRGRGALGTLLLGSVSHGIAHASDRNVLIVK
jgi:nucleotide-binding universal stress UspA family protein